MHITPFKDESSSGGALSRVLKRIQLKALVFVFHPYHPFGAFEIGSHFPASRSLRLKGGAGRVGYGLRLQFSEGGALSTISSLGSPG